MRYVATTWAGFGNLGVNEADVYYSATYLGAAEWASERLLLDASLTDATIDADDGQTVLCVGWLGWHGPALPCRCRFVAPFCVSLTHAVLLGADAMQWLP